jgi:hypothetical protein
VAAFSQLCRFLIGKWMKHEAWGRVANQILYILIEWFPETYSDNFGTWALYNEGKPKARPQSLAKTTA